MPNSRPRHICSVPPSLIKPAHIRHTPGLGNIAEYNIAVWLNLPGMHLQVVALALRYKDADKYQEILIDRGKINSRNKILLCGIARLAVKNKIESMDLYLLAQHLPADIQIDELFVQAVGQGQSDIYVGHGLDA